jgi:hypothetical protein
MFRNHGAANIQKQLESFKGSFIKKGTPGETAKQIRSLRSLWGTGCRTQKSVEKTIATLVCYNSSRSLTDCPCPGQTERRIKHTAEGRFVWGRRSSWPAQLDVFFCNQQVLV